GGGRWGGGPAPRGGGEPLGGSHPPGAAGAQGEGDGSGGTAEAARQRNRPAPKRLIRQVADRKLYLGVVVVAMVASTVCTSSSRARRVPFRGSRARGWRGAR